MRPEPWEETGPLVPSAEGEQDERQPSAPGQGPHRTGGEKATGRLAHDTRMVKQEGQRGLQPR